jgi:hypothetical protein
MDEICRKGVQALDDVLASAKPPEKDLIAEATRCIAAYRDDLIGRLRRGDEDAEPVLVQVNSLLSELVAAEFPLVGVRRKRIEAARDAYRRLLDEGAQRV